MSVHFGNPWALVLLVSLVPVVLWARRSLAGLGGARGGLALALRLAIVTLLVLSLARLQWAFRRDDLSVIYVLDRSLSIPAEARKAALRFIIESERRRRPGDTVGLVVFGTTAALERPAEPTPLFPAAEEAPQGSPGEAISLQSVVSPENTNIAAGLRLALGAFPPSGRKRIVLISDGNENLGKALEEAELARRNGVRVDVLPIRYRYRREVLVEKVTAPANVDEGESFEVRTVVQASTAHPARLHLYENGVLIGSQTVDLRPGRNVFVVKRRLPAPGYYTYRATIESPRDTLSANNTADSFTLVRGRGKVLYLEGDPQHAQPLVEALTSQGLQVDLRGPDALPLSLGELIPYDAVILSDVSASSLTEKGMQAVELAVKDWGVGLVMVGGERSFGPGGYQDTPVERALPVTMDIKQRRVMPSGALVVILHTCEIPEGNYWAQQVALAALRTLSSVDEYGIIYYDWQRNEQWLFPLQRVMDKERMANLIRRVEPGDMPSFITSLRMARKALKASRASIKHVVIISDGDPSYPSDAAVLSLRADGVTISTVAIAPHSQTDAARLAHVASIGGGRFYQPAQASSLPEIFIKEAATVRRALIFEETFSPRLALASEVLTGIGPKEFPPLEGYVCTTAKELAEVPLITHHDDPLLAHWQYGLGRAVAFTSDAKPRWAARWVSWEKFAQFWAQTVRWCSRRIASAGLRARTEISGRRVRLVVNALDAEGRFVNGLQLTGVVVTPENEEKPVRLEQTGPGHYQTTFEVSPEPGTYYLSLRYTDRNGRTRLYTHGFVVPYSSEFRELEADETGLATLAAVTEGRVLRVTDDVFERTFPPAARFQDAWPRLLLAAVLLVPLDVFVRRVFVDLGAVWARLLALVRILGLMRRRPAPAAQPGHVAALLERKLKTRRRLGASGAGPERGRKFEPSAVPDSKEPALTATDTTPKESIPAEPAAPPGAAEPAAEPEEDTYMSRLLRAKRKALRERGPRRGPGPSDPGTSENQEEKG